MKSISFNFLVLIFFAVLFSSCRKDTSIQAPTKVPVGSGKVESRGPCCGSAVINITSTPYDFIIYYLTDAGWQSTSCLPSTTTTVTVGGCCPDGSVLNVVAIPCGSGTVPANFSNYQFIATANGDPFVYRTVSFSTAPPFGPNGQAYSHREVVICP